MTFSVHSLFLTALAVLYALTVVAAAQTPDFLSLAIVASCLFGLEAALAVWAFRRNWLFLKIFLFFFAVWYLARMPSLIAWPETYLYVSLYHLGTDALVHDLLVLLAYFVVAAAVIGFFDWILRPRLPQTPPRGLDRLIAIGFAWWCLVLPLALLNLVVPHWGGGVLAFVQHVFDYNFSATFLGLLIALAYPWRRFATRWRAMAFLASYLGFSLLQAHRSAIYFPLLWAALVALAHPESFVRVTARNTAIVVLLALGSVAAFYAATTVRVVHQYHPGERITLPEVSAALLQFDFSHGAYGQSYSTQILRRISDLDDLVIVVDRENTRMAHLVSFSNVFKNIANEIVPGDIYPGVLPSSENFDIDYEDQPYDWIATHYSSRVPGLFAMSAALTSVPSGLAVTAGLLALYFGLVRLALTIAPADSRFYVLLLAIYYAYDLYNLMGADQFFFNDMIGTVLLQGGLFVLFWAGWTQLTSRTMAPVTV